MPIWYGPVPSENAFHVVYSGVIGLHDILGFFDRFEADFRLCPGHSEFCDARTVERVDITDRELRAVLSLVVGIYRRNDCNKRIAFVAPDGAARPVLDRVVAAFDAGLPTVRSARFDAQGPALDFIGLPRRASIRSALH